MSFGDDVTRFVVATQIKEQRVLATAAVEVYKSLTVGSAVTGSQGTPVDTGVAQNSWSVDDEKRDTGAESRIATIRPGEVREIVGGALYLQRLEEGHARTKPAGWVRLTVAMWPRIVAWANAQRANGPAVPGGASLRPSTDRQSPSRGRRKW